MFITEDSYLHQACAEMKPLLVGVPFDYSFEIPREENPLAEKMRTAGQAVENARTLSIFGEWFLGNGEGI